MDRTTAREELDRYYGEKAAAILDAVAKALCEEECVPVSLGYLCARLPAHRRQAKTAITAYLAASKGDG